MLVADFHLGPAAAQQPRGLRLENLCRQDTRDSETAGGESDETE
jgi:hypothetical protein